MGFVNFFSQFANTMVNRYQEMTVYTSNEKASRDYLASSAEHTPVTETPEDAYVDNDENKESEVPLTDSDDSTTSEPKVSDSKEAIYPKPTIPTDENLPETKESGDVGFFSRRAKLDYKMALQFDLAAISSVAESISEGDTTELTRFAAAGFGLSAGFDVKGVEIMETNMADKLDPATIKQYKSRQKEMTMSRFGAQSKNFQLNSFYRESSRISKSMKFEDFGNYRRSVNKFALRYRLDSSFGFANLEKFNVQTQQISEAQPDKLTDYVKSAGAVAETSTPEMMQTFFNTVDEYLSAAETDLRAKAEEFFTMVVEQLGFAEETVYAVKDQLLGSIDSFFGRVNEAVDMLESKFVLPENRLMDEIEPDVTPNVPLNADDKVEIAVA